jgi:hypothetical protein
MPSRINIKEVDLKIKEKNKKAKKETTITENNNKLNLYKDKNFKISIDKEGNFYLRLKLNDDLISKINKSLEIEDFKDLFTSKFKKSKKFLEIKEEIKDLSKNFDFKDFLPNVPEENEPPKQPEPPKNEPKDVKQKFFKEKLQDDGLSSYNKFMSDGKVEIKKGDETITLVLTDDKKIKMTLKTKEGNTKSYVVTFNTKSYSVKEEKN